MKSTIRIALILALFCATAFADGEMGHGGFTYEGEMGTGGKTCTQNCATGDGNQGTGGFTEGEMGTGGRTAIAVVVGEYFAGILG